MSLAKTLVFAAALCYSCNDFAKADSSRALHLSKCRNGMKLSMSTDIGQLIKTEIARNKVMIFSKSYCPFCNEAKSVFSELNAEYGALELDVMDGGDKIQAELFRMTGQRTVPNIFVKGQHLGGCDDTLAAKESGLLVKMLTESPTVEISEYEPSIQDQAIFDQYAEMKQENDRKRILEKKKIAFGSIFVGASLFFYQQLQPVSGVALLHTMEKDSVPLKQAVCNSKPTVLEFYADWCESCKAMAPTMRALEIQYSDKINFITVNGVDPKNSILVESFKVDGIPHVAFLTEEEEVKTALIGAVPKKILKEELDALIQGSSLPYQGYDAFEEQSHFPFGDTSKICAL